MSGDHLLELLFTQSLDGFFFMMLDEPIEWNDQADKEQLLDYAFEHQRVVLVNDAMLNQYGASRQDFLGHRPSDFFAHDLVRGREAWRQMFNNGHLHVNTHERRVDGTPIDIEGDYICLYDEDRRIIGHFGIQRDVTEQVRLQEAVAHHAAALETEVAARTADLRRSENRVRAIVNALPDLLFVIDRDGRYVEIVTENPRLLFRDAHDMLGRTFGEVLPRPVAELLLDTVRKTVDTGRSQTVEYALEVQSGPLWFEGRTSSSSPATSPTASEPPSWKARTSTCRRPSTRTCTSARSWADPRRCSKCSGRLPSWPTPIRRSWCSARPEPGRS